jgi:hypothetical protein
LKPVVQTCPSFNFIFWRRAEGLILLPATLKQTSVQLEGQYPLTRFCRQERPDGCSTIGHFRRVQASKHL